MAPSNPARAANSDPAAAPKGAQLTLGLDGQPLRSPVLVAATVNARKIAELPQLPNQTPPRFWQWQPVSLFWSIAENLAVMISAPVASLPATAWRDAPLLKSARMVSEQANANHKPAHWVLSLVGHCSLVTLLCLWPTVGDWNPPPHQPSVRELLDQYTILYYDKADLLPLIAPTSAKPSSPTSSPERALRDIPGDAPPESPSIRLAPARASQPIVSHRPSTDNNRQTIVMPQAPNILVKMDIEIPNLIAVNREMPAPAPAPRDYASQRIENLALPVLPPPEPRKAVPAEMAAKPDPVAPAVSGGAIRATEISLGPVATDDVPVPQVTINFRRPPEPAAPAKPVRAANAMPEPPSGRVVEPRFTDASSLGAGLSVRAEPVPRFPVPVRLTRPAEAPASRQVASKRMPEMPSISGQGSNVSSLDLPSLPTLVAVSLNAPPPMNEVRVPAANREGGFSADTTGIWSEGGSTGDSRDLSKATSSSTSDGSAAPGSIEVPGLSVQGEGSLLTRPVAAPNMRSRLPAPVAPSDVRQLLAGMTRPNLRPDTTARSRPPLDPFFGARRVYTSHVNMPNLSSRSGSWVLKFAEPQGTAGAGEISTPQVLRKVDPSYEAGAQREHIQGFVLLAAMLRRDGTITNVRLVQGLDSRLDLSAISAFTQWKFQPALRDGLPVELEVLVQIPFAIQ